MMNKNKTTFKLLVPTMVLPIFLVGCCKHYLPIDGIYMAKQVERNGLDRTYILKKHIEYTKIDEINNYQEITCSTKT